MWWHSRKPPARLCRRFPAPALPAGRASPTAVSYTQLDVYKRQVLHYGNVTPGTTTAKPSSGGKYTKDINKAIVYDELPAGDKMLGWKWSDLGVPAGEKVTKVEINLSTSKKQIGKWQGAFGSSTSVAPDYWTQSEDMEQTISGKTGSIVWDVDSATSAIIQTQYGGELKFGVWWIDCNKFTIDSITVYTDAYNGSGQITTTVSTTCLLYTSRCV